MEERILFIYLFIYLFLINIGIEYAKCNLEFH
jgi:hypothetical protein